MLYYVKLTAHSIKGIDYLWVLFLLLNLEA